MECEKVASMDDFQDIFRADMMVILLVDQMVAKTGVELAVATVTMLVINWVKYQECLWVAELALEQAVSTEADLVAYWVAQMDI